jgi:hypothetical protein
VSKKEKRSKEASAKHIARSIRKFGDSDGKRAESLAKLADRACEARK